MNIAYSLVFCLICLPHFIQILMLQLVDLQGLTLAEGGRWISAFYTHFLAQVRKPSANRQ